MFSSFSQWLDKLQQGGLDGRLSSLYGAKELPAQQLRYQQLLDAFFAHFGPDRELLIASAPGRTEIGGNHTDHQGGCVLAAAVTADMIAAVSPNGTDRIHLEAAGFGSICISLDQLQPLPEEQNTSAALLRGMAAALLKQGVPVSGFDGVIHSQIPVGAGLSSSAAFSILMGCCMAGLFGATLPNPVTLAQAAQQAEIHYFGKPCGLMDQLASALGGFVSIDFGNPAIPQVEKLSIDLCSLGLALCLTDTGGSHASLTEAYAAIPREMGQVAAYFGKPILSQVEESHFLQAIPLLRERLPHRAILRALHYFSETRRAQAQAQALKQQDSGAFLALVRASGHSSQTLLENICPPNSKERGLALALALSEQYLKEQLSPEQFAVRIHGGGFAGTIQTFLPLSLEPAYTAYMEDIFGPDCCQAITIRTEGGTIL